MRLARRGDGGIRILRATTTCCGLLIQSDSHIILIALVNSSLPPLESGFYVAVLVMDLRTLSGNLFW